MSEKKNFYNGLKLEKQFNLYFDIICINDAYFFVGMLIEIRYLTIFVIYDNNNFNIEKNINSVKQSLKFISNKSIKLGVGLQNDNSLINIFKTQNCQNYDIGKNKIIFNNNIKNIKKYLNNNNISIETICDYFNNKKNKGTGRESPIYWLNILKKNFDNNIDNNQKIINSNLIRANKNNTFEVDIINDNQSDILKNSDLKKDKIKEDSNFFIVYSFFSYIYAKINIILLETSQINKTLKENNELIKEKNCVLEKKCNELLKENMEIKKSLKFIELETKIREQERLEKLRKLEKKKNKKILPKRDKIEYKELVFLIELLEDDKSMYSYRKICAFLLLYTTGLRVSNLLFLKANNIKDILQTGYIRLDLVKKGSTQHLVIISKDSQRLLNKYFKYFEKIIVLKNDEDYFFSSFTNNQKPIHRATFNNDLNSTLKKLSDKFSKNIKTHSFRTSFINDLLEIAPLHIAKDIIGHKVVASTEVYYRSNLTKDKSMSILNKCDRVRFNFT